MSQSRKMPSKPPICREWENEPEMIQKKKRFGWVELPKHSCWRCGKDGYTERTHIHSRCFNQDDSPSNLHLLCHSCHIKSEGYTGWKDGHFYYEWFMTDNDDYWGVTVAINYSKFIENHLEVNEDDSDGYVERFQMWLENTLSYEREKNQTQILIPEPPLLSELLKEI